MLFRSSVEEARRNNRPASVLLRDQPGVLFAKRVADVFSRDGKFSHRRASVTESRKRYTGDSNQRRNARRLNTIGDGAFDSGWVRLCLANAIYANAGNCLVAFEVVIADWPAIRWETFGFPEIQKPVFPDVAGKLFGLSKFLESR